MTGQTTAPADRSRDERRRAVGRARAARPAAGAADHPRARGHRHHLRGPQAAQLPDGLQHPRDRAEHVHPGGARRRDDPRHHHRRHRPVGGQRAGLQRRRRRQGDGGDGAGRAGARARRRPGGDRLRARLGPDQRVLHRQGEGAAAHRHARHPRHGPRPRRGDHRRRGPAQRPDRHGQRHRVRQHRLADSVAGGHRGGRRRARHRAAAPHPVRAAHLRDRVQPGGGPAGRPERPVS